MKESASGSYACFLFRLRCVSIIAYLAPLAFIGSCTTNAIEPKDILVSSDGEVRQWPEFYWSRRLLLSDSDQKRQLLRNLLRIGEGEHSYASYVSLRVALKDLFVRKNYSYLTQDMFRVVCNKCLHISYEGPTSTPIAFASEVMEEEGWYDWPIHARLSYIVEGRELPLFERYTREGLPCPSGWRFRGLTIKLDGNVVHTQDRECEYLSEYIPLRNILDHDRLLGTHTWEICATIIAPNGVSCRIKKRWSFEILTTEMLLKSL